MSTQEQAPSKPDTTRAGAATNVPELISDLDGGVFERILSIALSQVGAAVTTQEKKGEVNLKMKFEHIKGTSQVRMEHELSFKKPTGSGTSSEVTKGATVLHVGRFGSLSITQPSLLERDTQMSLG